MILLGFWMVFKAHHDIVEYRSIVDDRLPKGFDQYCIFFISDIHRRKINPKTMKSIQNKIELIVIGGDLTEKGVPLERTRKNLRLLKEFGAPIYFVWGNNDYEINQNRLNQMFNEEKVNVLKDSYINIIRNDSTMSVIGFDYHEDDESQTEIDWQRIKKHYCLLLTHVPRSFYELDSYHRKNIHTVLAGHTHGGQIRIFGLGPYQRGGFHLFKQTNVLISEGYGYTFLPFRLQTNAECHVLTFKTQ